MSPRLAAGPASFCCGAGRAGYDEPALSEVKTRDTHHKTVLQKGDT